MLHIILGILKVIGIITGILLLILLAFFLAVVFVPVRYRLIANRIPGRYEVSARMSWLFHIVSASLSAGTGSTGEIAVRLFGIRLPLFRRAGSGRGREKPAAEDMEEIKHQASGAAPEKEDPTAAEPDELYGAPPGPQNADTNTDTNIDTNTDTNTDINTDTGTSSDGPEAERTSAFLDKIRQIPVRLAGFFRKLRAVPQRVKEIFRKLVRLLQRPGELCELAREYEMKEVFGGLFAQLLKLIRHYRPRHIRGYLRFGTGDPAATGQLTGLLYLLLPAGADRFTITPEFHLSVFETEIISTGHIRAVHLLRVFVRSLRDKKLRRLIKKLGKKGDSDHG